MAGAMKGTRKKKGRDDDGEKKEKSATAANNAALAAAQRALRGTMDQEMRQERGSLYRSAPDLADADLQRAKSKFFEVDQDGSGTIELDELVSMLHALGVEPSEEEVQKMLASADTEDSDGKIDMREFLQWYARGMKQDRDIEKEDVADAYRAVVRADPQSTRMPKDAIRSFLHSEYGLEYSKEDIEKLFELPPSTDSMHFDEFQKAVLTP